MMTYLLHFILRVCVRVHGHTENSTAGTFLFFTPGTQNFGVCVNTWRSLSIHKGFHQSSVLMFPVFSFGNYCSSADCVLEVTPGTGAAIITQHSTVIKTVEREPVCSTS